jgi:nucleoside-diphosphate-sugar epimerase
VRILVTGMSGLIGGLVGRHLARTHEVVALNRRPVVGVTTFQADVNDLEAIRPAFRGVDAVVHLAAYMGDDPAGYLTTNVAGVYNVFEASREARVKRVVFGSSGSTITGYTRDPAFASLLEGRWQDVLQPGPMLDHLVPPRPDSVYGAAKLFGEALGRYYSDFHGISVICVRIGPVPPEDRPKSARQAASYCSHRDVVQMIDRCVTAPESVRFDVFYAVSNNRGRYRDIEHARKVVGYQPQDGIRDWPA